MLVLKEPEEGVVGYGLDTDEFNIILYKLQIVKDGAAKGTTRKVAIGYFNSVASCLERVYLSEVCLVGLSDLGVLDKAVRSTIATCEQSLKSFRSQLQGSVV